MDLKDKIPHQNPPTCTSLTLSDSLNRYLQLQNVCYTVYLWYRHRYIHIEQKLFV